MRAVFTPPNPHWKGGKGFSEAPLLGLGCRVLRFLFDDMMIRAHYTRYICGSTYTIHIFVTCSFIDLQSFRNFYSNNTF